MNVSIIHMIFFSFVPILAYTRKKAKFKLFLFQKDQLCTDNILCINCCALFQRANSGCLPVWLFAAAVTPQTTRLYSHACVFTLYKSLLLNTIKDKYWAEKHEIRLYSIKHTYIHCGTCACRMRVILNFFYSIFILRRIFKSLYEINR